MRINARQNNVQQRRCGFNSVAFEVVYNKKTVCDLTLKLHNAIHRYGYAVHESSPKITKKHTSRVLEKIYSHWVTKNRNECHD